VSGCNVGDDDGVSTASLFRERLDGPSELCIVATDML
jgi:hypothetical protein